MRKETGIKSLLTFIVLTLMLSSCTSQYLVPLENGGNESNRVRAITKSQDGVEITVLPSIWEGNPYFLKHYITPVYVEIKNSNDTEIEFDYKDSALIIFGNLQYSPLSPENAAGILSSSDRQSKPVQLASSIQFGFGFGHFHRFGYYDHYYDPFYDPFYYPFYYRDYYYPERTVDTSDVYARAITSASIRPGARVSGFLYFKKLPEEVSIVTLQVSYSAAGESEKRYIEFPFSVLVTRN